MKSKFFIEFLFNFFNHINLHACIKFLLNFVTTVAYGWSELWETEERSRVPGSVWPQSSSIKNKYVLASIKIKNSGDDHRSQIVLTKVLDQKQKSNRLFVLRSLFFVLRSLFSVLRSFHALTNIVVCGLNLFCQCTFKKDH